MELKWYDDALMQQIPETSRYKDFETFLELALILENALKTCSKTRQQHTQHIQTPRAISFHSNRPRAPHPAQRELASLALFVL